MGLSDTDRARLARPLAEFLQTLHSPEISAAVTATVELPTDPMQRADMPARVARASELLAKVERLGLWHPLPLVQPLLQAASTLPTPKPHALVHGDLHFRHLLVDQAGALTGIIDWGDLCRADPSIDLPLLWCFLPPTSRASFLAAYGPTTEEQLLRARVLALFLCAALAVYAHHEHMDTIEREAVAGLTRTATD